MTLPRQRIAAALAAVAVAVLCLIAVKMTAEEGVANVRASKRFAEQHCANCHSIGAADKSPFPDAPPFRTFAQKWPLESVEEALAEGIVVGHEAMPEFELSPRQIADFIGYLRTLNPGESPGQ
jgi:mono/diheme cytochrome c family protein